MNYFMINGQRIDLTEEQAKAIHNSLHTESMKCECESGKKKLSEVEEGETFKIGNTEFIVLEQGPGRTFVITKELYVERQRFGNNNNFDGSDVEKVCDKFAAELAELIGEDNLCEHVVDLTSDDGLKDYGSVDKKVSLLTAEDYRFYVHILDKYKVDKWCWLATPWSTPTHEDADCIKCVSPYGRIGDSSCNSVDGVRPFCILKSDIFVC